MTGVMPPGGWRYAENGKMIVDDAVSYEDLINKLSQYRAFCGLPLGNPQQDIDRYICATYPNMCGGHAPEPEEGVDQVELSYGQPVQKKPRERVMNWAVNRMQKAGQIEFADKDEAERRAAICYGCPQKVQWNEPIEGCPGCQAYVEKAEVMLVKIRANKQIAFHSMLDGLSCKIAGHDLGTAVWLEEPALRHRWNYKGQLPPPCWMNDL